MMIGRFNGGTIAFAIIALFLQSAGAQPTTTTEDGEGPPKTYTYGRFTPSMAILLVIFIVVVFLMGFFAVYIRHCSAAARGTITPSGLGRTSALRGLDPSILNTFPTFSYSEIKSHKIGKGALECAVCLTAFDDDEEIDITLRLLPKCDHVFHAECIDAWLASHSTCPVCRSNLEAPLEPSGLVESAPTEPVAEVGLTIAEPESVARSKSSNRVRPHKAFDSFSKFPRSHSTGHCLVQPGENVDRFTLKLPSEIRNQIMNRALNRSSSVVVLPSANSLRKGRGSMDRVAEDRSWWWSGLFVRNGSSVKLGACSNGGNGEGTSRIMGIVRQMSLKGFGSRKDRTVRDDKSIRPAGVRRLGAAAVDMCHVALRIVEAYWEYRLTAWDIAAGVLLKRQVEQLVIWTVKACVFDRSVSVSNNVIHSKILERLAPATEKLKKNGTYRADL